MNCVESKLKKYTSRNSPPFPANECPEGMIKKGNDGVLYIVKKGSNGVNRWVKYVETSASNVSEKPKSVSKKIEKPLPTTEKPKSVSKKIEKPAKEKPVQAPKHKDYSKLTIPKIKQHLDKLGIAYKKSAKKAELLALIPSQQQTEIKIVQEKKTQKPIPATEKPVQAPKHKDYSKLTIPKIKQHLDKLGIAYKKSAKKAELLALIPSQQQTEIKIVQEKKSIVAKTGKIIHINEFKDGKTIQLNPLGSYKIEKYNDTISLDFVSYGKKINITDYITPNPKLYTLEYIQEGKVDTKNLHIGDILNFGDYRLYNGYIVTYNDQNQLYLRNYTIDDYFAIPKEVSRLFFNPVEVYSNIDDVEVVEMTFPNGFLEIEYGLTPDLNIPSDIIFEYVIFANQLNVMKPSVGKGFTVESKQKGQPLASYITQQTDKIKK